ncbi:hypothetical protein AC1031_013488 [Aphanomyces cochlioides]|nr:hypothetical protein AC1031_013488 [Aphanomyces cochlioides]
MLFVYLLALVSVIGSVYSCTETIWQMGYGTQWVVGIPHVYVAMVPIGGRPQDLQGMRCLRAELYIANARAQFTRTPSFKIEPHNTCTMTANSVASRRNLQGGVFGNLCASRTELEAVMPLARVMNAANTEAAKYVLLKNDCMNYAANFMAIAWERYAYAGESRQLTAENKLIKRGSSKSIKTLLSEIMKVMYTDPELKKAAEELKKVEKSEPSSNALAKQSSKKIETKQSPNKAPFSLIAKVDEIAAMPLHLPSKEELYAFPFPAALNRSIVPSCGNGMASPTFNAWSFPNNQLENAFNVRLGNVLKHQKQHLEDNNDEKANDNPSKEESVSIPRTKVLKRAQSKPKERLKEPHPRLHPPPPCHRILLDPLDWNQPKWSIKQTIAPEMSPCPKSPQWELSLRCQMFPKVVLAIPPQLVKKY